MASSKPHRWVGRATIHAPMTAKQKEYLRGLCRQKGVRYDPELTRGQASRLIDRLSAPSS